MLDYSIPLIFKEPAKEKGKKVRTCTLEYSTGIFSLLYWRHKPNLRCPPEAIPVNEGFPLYSLTALSIPPGSQVIVNTHISFDLPTKLSLNYTLPKARQTASLIHAQGLLIPLIPALYRCY